MNDLKVIDFFCGAGGFSEGFRQLGFKITYGYDHWNPAVETFNFNFNLNCKPKNILDFKIKIDEIENIPDTEIIIGSPPCVSFSSSNKSGSADKSLGVELTETFLKIIAVKKHKPGSVLRAWFMENVVNSRKFLQNSYTFKDLGLEDWAINNLISPTNIAIDLFDNFTIINSADYGSFQSRKRVICGSIIPNGKLVIPKVTHGDNVEAELLPYQTIGKMKNNFFHPYSPVTNHKIKDPQYPIEIPQTSLTDHFYDTGIYKSEWRVSKFYKVNHPFMGKMSFPENENKPSRTITATKIANSRESIIYKSEIKRYEDGEYRLPTVREAAIIMGFPITYQFLGTENTKWRLVGNAVCCSVSRALASTVIEKLNLKRNDNLIINSRPNLQNVPNLNTYSVKRFDKAPLKKNGSKFRRHPFKDGNLTVTLSNYEIDSNQMGPELSWYASIQYGTGKGFPIQKVEDKLYLKIEEVIKVQLRGEEFLELLNSYVIEKIGSSYEMQNLYEMQKSNNNILEPTELIELVGEIINRLNIEKEEFVQNDDLVFLHKKTVPLKQLFALYAISKISTISKLLK